MFHVPFGAEAEPQETELPRLEENTLSLYLPFGYDRNGGAPKLAPAGELDYSASLHPVVGKLPDTYAQLNELIRDSVTGIPERKDYERHIAALDRAFESVQSYGKDVQPPVVAGALTHRVELMSMRRSLVAAEENRLKTIASRLGPEVAAGEFWVAGKSSEYGPSTAPVVVASFVGVAVVQSQTEGFHRVAMEPVIEHDGVTALFPAGLTIAQHLYAFDEVSSAEAV